MDIELLNAASGLLHVGRLEDALWQFRKLESCTVNPVEKAMVLLNVSACLERMGRIDEALTTVSEAAALSDLPEVQCNALVASASLHQLGRKPQAALEELERALRNYPEVLRSGEYRFLYEDVQVRRGLLLVQQEQLDQARVVLEECLSFDLDRDNRWKVFYNLARCYFDVGETKHSKQMFLMFLKEQGDAVHIASAHHLLGAIYYRGGDYSKALAEFLWCLPNADEVGMPKSTIYGWLANTYKALGNMTESERYSALAENQ